MDKCSTRQFSVITPPIASEASNKPSMRIIGCGHAGSSAYTYSIWKNYLPEKVSHVSVTLPGWYCVEQKGCDFDLEIDDLESYCKKVLEELVALPPVPIVIFGTSFGSLVAHCLAGQLLQSPIKHQVLGVILTARQAPDRNRPLRYLSHLPANEISAEIIATIGVPGNVPIVNDYRSFGKALRCDLALDETFSSKKTQKILDTRLITIAPLQDIVPVQDVHAWGAFYSTHALSLTLNKGHFFAIEQPHLVIEAAMFFLPKTPNINDMQRKIYD